MYLILELSLSLSVSEFINNGKRASGWQNLEKFTLIWLYSLNNEYIEADALPYPRDSCQFFSFVSSTMRCCFVLLYVYSTKDDSPNPKRDLIR